LREFAAGDQDPTIVCVRHDIDHSAEHALDFARWEHKNGIRASYYLLPGAPYYQNEAKQAAIELQELGHEVGVHNNAYTRSRGRSDAALRLLRQQADEMRSWGITVSGCADHGGAEPNNTLLWKTRSPTEAGLEYEAYLLHRTTHYISDNKGKTLVFSKREDRPTHILCHPCHWRLP
jgi:hypothetical protein